MRYVFARYAARIIDLPVLEFRLTAALTFPRVYDRRILSFGPSSTPTRPHCSSARRHVTPNRAPTPADHHALTIIANDLPAPDVLTRVLLAELSFEVTKAAQHDWSCLSSVGSAAVPPRSDCGYFFRPGAGVPLASWVAIYLTSSRRPFGFGRWSTCPRAGEAGARWWRRPRRHPAARVLHRTASRHGLTPSRLALAPESFSCAVRPHRSVSLHQSCRGWPRNMPIDTFVILMMENRSVRSLPIGCSGRRTVAQSVLQSPEQSRVAHPLVPALRLRQVAAGSLDPPIHSLYVRSCARLRLASAWYYLSCRDSSQRLLLNRGSLTSAAALVRSLVRTHREPGRGWRLDRTYALTFTASTGFLCALSPAVTQPPDPVHSTPPSPYVNKGTTLGAGVRDDRGGARARRCMGFPRLDDLQPPQPAGVSNSVLGSSNIFTYLRCRAVGRRRLLRSARSTVHAGLDGTWPHFAYATPFQGETQGTFRRASTRSPTWRVGRAFRFRHRARRARVAAMATDRRCSCHDEWALLFSTTSCPAGPDLRANTNPSRTSGQMGFLFRFLAG